MQEHGREYHRAESMNLITGCTSQFPYTTTGPPRGRGGALTGGAIGYRNPWRDIAIGGLSEMWAAGMARRIHGRPGIPGRDTTTSLITATMKTSRITTVTGTKTAATHRRPIITTAVLILPQGIGLTRRMWCTTLSMAFKEPSVRHMSLMRGR